MTRTTPRFIREGYGLREEGKPIIGCGITGIKPGAPQWVYDEFERRMQELQVIKEREKDSYSV